MPIDWLNLLSDDEEDGGNLSRSPRNPYINNLSRYTGFDDEFSDVEDYSSDNDRSNLTTPNSPEYNPGSELMQKFMSMENQEVPSQGMIRDYLSSRPNPEDYKVGTGKKILAGVLGGIGGLTRNPLGINLGREMVHGPYQEALSEWQTQGKFLPTQARLADQANNRKILGAKFAVEQEGKKASSFKKAENEALKNSMAGEKAALTEQDRIAKEKRAEEKDALAAKREERLARSSEATLANSEASRKRLEEESAIRKSEKESKLQSARYNESRIKAASKVKNDPNYVKYFEDPTDDRNFRIKDNLPDNIKEEIIAKIKLLENTYSQMMGVK